MYGAFVTGTGTDVGKTLVAALLLKAIRENGISAFPIKPVQTGCNETDGSLSAPDLEFCIRMAGFQPAPELLEQMCPFQYLPSCSPHLAGRLSGIQPDVISIRRKMEELSRHCDFLVAEGAGGILVPLNDEETILDLMIELNWPVILVARGDLGTINHTLLSLAVLRQAGLHVAAVVVNHVTEKTSIVTRDNPLAIAKFGKTELMIEIPFMSNAGGAGSDTAIMREMLRLGERILSNHEQN